ncbi:hypothetical protein [Nonomuraea soli]|uniref:Type II secretory pathway pseudopilin PulG n=1 Tax=Nonomuraea soli TaxID=1032476 RepID=A0A7W0CIQ1_9ACTN|nr:hypothetical protein [Nonomuraea soli]MBA2891898.1 type II secretory pathway pseudopilin PulG [Nonomuraea soli]
MEAIIAGVIAIVGTLLGSLVTYIFQRRSTARAEEFTISARLREERMGVYSGFAGTILELRSAQYNRAIRGFDGKDSAEYAEARSTSQRIRVVAWQALYRVRLVADAPEVTELAESAMARVADMHDSKDMRTLVACGDDVRTAVEAFVAAAKSEVAWENRLTKPRTAELPERGGQS